MSENTLMQSLENVFGNINQTLEQLEDEKQKAQHRIILVQMALGQIDRNIAECDERIKMRNSLMAENGPDYNLQHDNHEDELFSQGLKQARGLIEKALKTD